MPPQPGPDGKRVKPKELEQFTEEQLQEMAAEIAQGRMPKLLQQMEAKHTDADGNPIIDEEGGATIQPNPGFVVKTKDDTGQKVFINVLHHDLVEPMQEQHIAPEEAAKLNSADTGVKIPLSLDEVKEDRDKKGEPSQVYDFIFNPKTV